MAMDMTEVNRLGDVSSEAGIVASIMLNPELTFYSEKLTAHHFTVESNGYLYFAVSELAKMGVTQIDAYNITNILNHRESTKAKADTILPIPAIKDFIDNAPNIARTTVEDYMVLVNNVLNAALRRNTYYKLAECQNLCINSSDADIEQKIYSTLDGVMMEFSSTNEIPQYKDVVDDMWEEIKARQDSGKSGIPFKFPTLNQFATIEPGELFIFAAEAKQGKSMILLNEAVDLMKMGLKVLYIDSELNSRMFTTRLLAHIAGVEFNRVRSGRYNKEEEAKIEEAREWMKGQSFTHLYMPIFDSKSVYTAVKRVYHTQGIDVLIIDYFKSTGDQDAFATYQEMGKLVDLVKNVICGELNIAGIGAAQANASGKIADSAKIGRNASTIAIIQDKLPDEIENDGPECGNKKLRVVLNRNGAQMAADEYIDLSFNGNLISYEEAKQHTLQAPY